MSFPPHSLGHWMMRTQPPSSARALLLLVAVVLLLLVAVVLLPLVAVVLPPLVAVVLLLLVAVVLLPLVAVVLQLSLQRMPSAATAKLDGAARLSPPTASTICTMRQRGRTAI